MSSVPTQPVRENSKKIPTKFEKLKYTIIASFQAKRGWARLRKRENKNYRSAMFLHDGLEKIPKKQQKNKKNTIMALFQPKIGWKMLRKRK